MTTKLTLTMDKAVIEAAKQHAREQDRSLSNLVESYLRSITNDIVSKEEDEELSPIARSLKGSFKAPKDFDYKKELAKRLEKKYL